jgi:hypothetical protein
MDQAASPARYRSGRGIFEIPIWNIKRGITIWNLKARPGAGMYCSLENTSAEPHGGIENSNKRAPETR